jgi:hypothetical protein
VNQASTSNAGRDDSHRRSAVAPSAVLPARTAADGRVGSRLGSSQPARRGGRT